MCVKKTKHFCDLFDRLEVVSDISERSHLVYPLLFIFEGMILNDLKAALFLKWCSAHVMF